MLCLKHFYVTCVSFQFDGYKLENTLILLVRNLRRTPRLQAINTFIKWESRPRLSCSHFQRLLPPIYQVTLSSLNHEAGSCLITPPCMNEQEVITRVVRPFLSDLGLSTTFTQGLTMLTSALFRDKLGGSKWGNPFLYNSPNLLLPIEARRNNFRYFGPKRYYDTKPSEQTKSCQWKDWGRLLHAKIWQKIQWQPWKYSHSSTSCGYVDFWLTQHKCCFSNLLSFVPKPHVKLTIIIHFSTNNLNPYHLSIDRSLN